MATTYESLGLYVRSATSLVEKIEKIDQVIIGLLDLAVSQIANADIKMISTDTGQSKIMTQYRSMDEVLTAIKNYEDLKEILSSKLNGRTMKLIPRGNA